MNRIYKSRVFYREHVDSYQRGGGLGVEKVKGLRRTDG